VLKKEGYTVSERLLSIDELAKALEDGSLKEAWGCGTAAVVSPIGELCYKGVKHVVNEGKIGEVTQHLYDVLTGIQWGRVEDSFGWTLPID
jgi:branched-chain amino acid aminotransferase